MINKIDNYIKTLIEIRDSEYVASNLNLKGWVCNAIAHCYHLECCFLINEKLNSHSENFFTANSAINRKFRDWGLDDVADIYNELRLLAKDYIIS
jgi:hypothetical protein